MYKVNNSITYSPSDLTTFMASPFASWMNRLSIECPDKAPAQDETDEFAELLSDKGLQHEQKLLNDFKKQGFSIAEITSECLEINASSEQKIAATIDAMKQGVDVIFQATLKYGEFIGFADFLVKVTGKSSLGDYYYEVWDTKLSSKLKPSFVIQLCCYAQMLEDIQGRRPESIIVALGNGDIEKLRCDDYFYYYLTLKQDFLVSQNKFNPNEMPDPADSKNFGRWSTFAEDLLLKKNHLSLIANISRSQIKRLNKLNIYTCDELIQYDTSKRIPGLNNGQLKTLIAQAAIQKASNGQIPPLFEIMKPEPDKKIGLALLPPHSKFDVFFDIEGYPLDEGGLEYLWGNTYFDKNGERQFIDFWAHDKVEEKKAFQEFIQWVYARWQQDPSMHIYHYANYEIAACRKLMSRYGICEYEVDQLLRNEVFVDLYKVVKSGLLLGEPRYSIKNVEHLYRGKRDTEVGNGGESVVVYEQWRDNFINGLDGGTWQTSQVLKDIRDYNIDDCDSTQELVDWLREQQASHQINYIGKIEVEEPEVPEEVTKRTQLRDRLLEKAEQIDSRLVDSEKADAKTASLTENMAWSLEFHRREAKPIFWRLFDRIGLSVEELHEDIDCLAGCIRTEREAFKPTPRARNLAYEFSFDIEQEFKGSSKIYYVVGEEDAKGNSLKVTVLKKECDFENGILVVTTGIEPSNSISLVPNEYVRPDPIPAAIDDVVEDFDTTSNKGQLTNSAIMDFMQRLPPKIKGREDLSVSIVTSDEPTDRLGQIINAVVNLDKSYLTIQGPPGSGKTFTGKQIIAELVKRGKRVGISSNSHKAINNLLLGVADFCKQKEISVECFCTKDTGNEIADNKIGLLKNGDIINHLTDGVVIGTTAWGFCRDDLKDEFDYLFIDEAGQVSVANLLGMSRATENIVLMGDQMQLGQPSQGTHPADSGLSILDYLLHDSPIIPANMGIFLDTTYRMHSKVNEFISQAIYEGQLQSHVDNDKQVISVPAGYQGGINIDAGVLFIPVTHEGNTQASDEEVAVIAEKANELLGREFTDKNGDTRIIDWKDMLFVAPYNHQVSKLQIALGEDAKVGSVDKFQGQEAPIIFFSLCASDAAESARGIDFLFDKHRINVAISRAQSLAIVVGNPKLFSTPVNSIEQMEKVNVLARFKFMLNNCN